MIFIYFIYICIYVYIYICVLPLILSHFLFYSLLHEINNISVIENPLKRVLTHLENILNDHGVSLRFDEEYMKLKEILSMRQARNWCTRMLKNIQTRTAALFTCATIITCLLSIHLLITVSSSTYLVVLIIFKCLSIVLLLFDLILVSPPAPSPTSTVRKTFFTLVFFYLKILSLANRNYFLPPKVCNAWILHNPLICG
jgi:hypothetical protein